MENFFRHLIPGVDMQMNIHLKLSQRQHGIGTLVNDAPKPEGRKEGRRHTWPRGKGQRSKTWSFCRLHIQSSYFFLSIQIHLVRHRLSIRASVRLCCWLSMFFKRFSSTSAWVLPQTIRLILSSVQQPGNKNHVHGRVKSLRPRKDVVIHDSGSTLAAVSPRESKPSRYQLEADLASVSREF
ncbi:hypothetical protein PAXRUDRAFT_323792 [Paxillus rubicundulus Ve08.2h10]|uniref:Uncharacterized protein n=1 Tax=Paxillus rubicundulus Ve08.2h10 TaxID=930991 RepID=A0A0D0DJZ0_9AGAM|nr:hypothetical protein PAXRUDRAFT_323792 [Paxillus rubicundulus Ve08.2h10]